MSEEELEHWIICHDDPDRGPYDDWQKAVDNCRTHKGEIVKSYPKGYRSGLAESLRKLAIEALEAQKDREGEDIDAWAQKLAEDSVAIGEAEYGPDYGQRGNEARVQVFGEFEDGDTHLCWEGTRSEHEALKLPFECPECLTQYELKDELDEMTSDKPEKASTPDFSHRNALCISCGGEIEFPMCVDCERPRPEPEEFPPWTADAFLTHMAGTGTFEERKAARTLLKKLKEGHEFFSVWTVWGPFHDEPEVLAGIFSSLERAEAYVEKTSKDESWFIREWIVNGADMEDMAPLFQTPKRSHE